MTAMNVLTFDVEDWFHVLDHASTKTEKEWSRYHSRIHANSQRILDLLDKRGLRATFFCLGWIARTYPEVVREIASRGHEIACHSDMHQLVYEMGPRRFAEDLDAAIGAIESVTGQKTTSYRAPGFSVTPECSWFFEILISRGIEVDCSIFPAQRAHGGYAGFGAAAPVWVRTTSGRIKELPINTVTVLGRSIIFSGGGYFRLLPRWLIRYWMRRAPYVMTYFHPRDFDPDQPMIEGLSLARRFKSYYGLRGALPKLDALLAEFDFVDLRQAVASTDWACVREVAMGRVDDMAQEVYRVAS